MSAKDIAERVMRNAEVKHKTNSNMKSLISSSLNSSEEELIEAFDAEGNLAGLFPRSVCHQNNTLAHRAVHVLVFNSKGELLLQKRSAHKDLYPLTWDTSVGGHLSPEESYREAANRECLEELGFEPATLKFLYSYTMLADRETEFVETFYTVYDGPFALDPKEVIAIRPFSLVELFSMTNTEQFSSFFLEELRELKRYMDEYGGIP